MGRFRAAVGANTHAAANRARTEALEEQLAEDRRRTRTMVMQLLGLTPGLTVDEGRETIEESFSLILAHASDDDASDDDRLTREMVCGLIAPDDATDAEATQALEELLDAVADDEAVEAARTLRR